MKKKYTVLTKVFLLIICVLAFFTLFKIFKGKSFFDTIAEYQNDIYSENSPIENLYSNDYFARYEENIPIKYEEISKIDNIKYIVKNKNNIYLYNSKEENETLIASLVNKDKEVFEIIANENWVVWGESFTKETDNKILYDWTIWAKSIKDLNSNIIKIDSGQYEKFKEEQRNFNSLIPDSFSIENNKLLYRKITRTEKKKNNIISDLVTSELILYDFTNNSLNSIYGLGDVSIELVSNPKISNSVIAFEKKILPNQQGIFTRTEVYTYNILSKEFKKIIEGENILSVDLKGNHIITLLGNTDPSIFIFDLNDTKKLNILYRGSRAQKYISNKDNNYEIYSLEFINNDNFIINYRSDENKLGSLIYNIYNKKFYNIENEINDFILDNDYNAVALGTMVFRNELRIYLGNFREESTNEKREKDINNKNIDKEDNLSEILVNDEEFNSITKNKDIYYKFLVYKLK